MISSFPELNAFEDLPDVRQLKRSQRQILVQHWQAGDKHEFEETCLTMFTEKNANFAREKLEDEVQEKIVKFGMIGEDYDFHTLVVQMFRQKPPVSRAILTSSCENITGNLIYIVAGNINVDGLIKDSEHP